VSSTQELRQHVIFQILKERTDYDLICLSSERSEASSSNSYTKFKLFYGRKEHNKVVNIFHKHIYHLTI